MNCSRGIRHVKFECHYEKLVLWQVFKVTTFESIKDLNCFSNFFVLGSIWPELSGIVLGRDHYKTGLWLVLFLFSNMTTMHATDQFAVKASGKMKYINLLYLKTTKIGSLNIFVVQKFNRDKSCLQYPKNSK